MKTIIKTTIITAIIFGIVYLADYTYQNYADAFQYFFAGVLIVVVWIGVYVALKE